MSDSSPKQRKAAADYLRLGGGDLSFHGLNAGEVLWESRGESKPSGRTVADLLGDVTICEDRLHLDKKLLSGTLTAGLSGRLRSSDPRASLPVPL